MISVILVKDDKVFHLDSMGEGVSRYAVTKMNTNLSSSDVKYFETTEEADAQALIDAVSLLKMGWKIVSG